MPTPFTLSVVSPDRTVVDQPVVSVMAPGVEGHFGVLAGHVPMIAALKTGIVEYVDTNDQKHYVSVSSGFMEVSGENAIVLADSAERSTEIDTQRAEAALERARAAIAGTDGEPSREEAHHELARAINRLKAAKLIG